MKDIQNRPLVCLKNISHSYKLKSGNIQVLKHINLSIYSGQSVALMGPSGSGKSTLLHMIGCLERPTEGSYRLNQQQVSQMSDVEMSLVRASQIGFVFQSFNLIPHLNVFENVRVPFFYQSSFLPEKMIQERILSAIECVRLAHRMHHLPSQLSGGECQRVAIARALSIRPLLILADEPTGNLDSETGKAILNLFQELNQQGSTLVIVTHDPFVASHCQQILKMQDGELIK